MEMNSCLSRVSATPGVLPTVKCTVQSPLAVIGRSCAASSVSARQPLRSFLVLPRVSHRNSTFRKSPRLKSRAFLLKSSSCFCDQPSVALDSLRILEWDKVCDAVASFAGTSLGKEATKEKLWKLTPTFEDSISLLKETRAAVEMCNYGAMMEFAGIDVELVKFALQCAHRDSPVSGSEAVALAALLQFADAIKSNVKSAIKQDSEWYERFMPLTEMIMELESSRPLVSFIQELVDEDGSVKDSASSTLKQSRDQVHFLERKLYQLMEALIRNETGETSFLEVRTVDGRWCIASGSAQRVGLEGLLLSSGSGMGSVIEPLPAVTLNNELQQARASVAKAEADVLLKITKKMQEDLYCLENTFNIIVKLDAINARAQYGLSYGGTYPDLFYPRVKDNTVATDAMLDDETSIASHPSLGKWTLYIPKAHHPLLLRKHRENLHSMVRGSRSATSVAESIQAPPVPVDIFIDRNTKVLVITGPNTGGKTISLKTFGLAALMAKSGLYVLASEPVKIPWFDLVLADIGDEQSLCQSLSTFSGHLKQISKIQSCSTSMSLVLLDEVGAGTNPLEGAALGMSLLESFAEAGTLLTIATTHHGELKTLKYSFKGFENACMEFDEVKLKPTYKILWGVPGRSNAINIAERLGMPKAILDNARELYGAANLEINEVILEMERFKQQIHEQVHETQHYLKLSKELYKKLLVAKKRIAEHGMEQRYRKMEELSRVAAAARSELHRRARQFRASPRKCSETVDSSDLESDNANSLKTESPNEATREEIAFKNLNPHVVAEKKAELPKVGDMVHILSLGKKALVLKVDSSRAEIVVQAGNMRLKLKASDVVP
ncbi:unnamed protein product [Cuscuta campestris]|uniref:DNA mismatch repair proteins mutS family domain-containing protein n=1 Tax=Cuscuta campestris TaxID=132261 RepID=A0A484L874_9ASTE|nr:unnamed protein product [Cuscuta campestris]